MANLSNINNKFIVTDGGDVMINNTIAGYPNGEGLTVKSSNNICRVVLQNSVSGGSVNDGFRIGLVNSNVEFENTESGEFQFYTGGGAAKMTIDSSGNVGIGTTSPSQKLDTPNIVIGGSSIAASYRANSTMMDNLGGVARFYSLGPNTSTGGSYQFNSLSSNLTAGVGTVMTILNTGNVGIGTTSPSGKLTISDANATGLEINPLDSQNRVNIMAYDRADSAYREINFDGSNYNFEIANSTKLVINSSGNVIQSGTSPQYQFVTPNNYNFQIAVQENVSNALEITPSTAAGGTTFSTPAVVINSSGNVGIGTISPNQKLEVAGRIRVTTDPTIEFYESSSKRGGIQWSTANDYTNIFAVGGDIRFDIGGEKLRITSGGNVGIGTTSPTNYKLEVDGTVEGSAFSVDGASSRIFAPAGATYNGSGTQTGYLIAKLPDNGAFGINNMMTGVIRVFDYTFHESFDIHFAGYWYSGYNWTNCTAWIDSSSYDDRNFTVRFGAMTGAAGAGTRPYITIGEANATWSYCKFSVINYEPGHSNYQAYKWDSGWNMDISATNPGVVARTISNCQVNNWARNGQDLYYGSGTGNVGIGTTTPNAKLEIAGTTEQRYLQVDAIAGFAGISSSMGAMVEFFNSGDGNNVKIKTNNSTRTDAAPFSVWTDANSRFIIRNDGNVGIGTTSPSGLLHLKGDTNSNGAEIYLQVNNNNTTDNLGAIHFGNNIDSTLSEILSQTSGANNSSSLIFSTSSTGTKAERMRIKSDGNILVADTRRIQFYNTDQYIGATSTNDLEIQAGDDINYRSNFSRFFSGTTEHCRVSGLSNQNNWIANGTGGKLGIGTTSPTAKLHVASSVNADVIFKLENTNTGTSAGAKIELIDDEGGSGSGAGALRHSISSISQTAINWVIGSGSAAGQLDFSTVDSFIMRLDESQNVLIGKTSQGLSIAGIEAASNATLRATKNNSSPVEFNRLGTDGDIVLFYKNTAGKGSISITSSAVSYNTSSDYRLKEDLQDFTGLDMVSKIPVYDFKWKTDENRSYGVMAHELQEVLPDAVSGDKDAEEMQGVDYSKIVPLLVKSIQELKAEIELLKSK